MKKSRSCELSSTTRMHASLSLRSKWAATASSSGVIVHPVPPRASNTVLRRPVVR